MKKEDYYQNMKSKWSSDYPSPKTIGEIWDFYEECGYQNPQNFFQRILNQVKWKNHRLLDFGCDNGLLLNFICEMVPKIEGYGIDINEQAIEKAKESFPNLKLLPFNGIEIPFEDNYFDVVFTSAVIKHIRYEDRHAVYNEMKRVANTLFVIEVDSQKEEEVPHRGWTFYHSHFEKEFAERFEPIDVFSECGDLWGLYNL